MTDSRIENLLSQGEASYTMSSLYDNAYIQGRKNASKIAYTSRDLNKLYNSPSDRVSFTDTLEKVGKVDTTTKYFSPTQLYDRDGRYQWKSLDEYYNGKYDNNATNSSYRYMTTYNTFTNSSYSIVSGDSQIGYTARGVIDPSQGTPIRLKAPDGFAGYIQCLTKNNQMIVPLASAPQNISDNLQVNTASDTAIGRSQGFTFFSDVSSRQVSFTFDVYADYLPSPYLDVLSYCKALKQMNYPTYSSTIVNSPLVRFEYGGLHIIGIPTITFSFDNTIKKGNIDKATVSVSIIETEDVTDGKAIL